jgi:hypothetical protein
MTPKTRLRPSANTPPSRTPVDQSLQEINVENAEHRAEARSKSEISLLDGLAREQFGGGAAGANAAGFEQISAVHDVQYLPDGFARRSEL